VHPFLTQDDVRAVNAEHGVATEAWSPIAKGQVLDNPVIKGIATEHGKTPAQVVLRWHVQRGDIVFPKSVTRERVQENFEIFDFELSPSEIGFITALNKDERTGPNPDEFNYIP
jgi:2,5-diketo-D-gluconate reductase A